MNGHLKESSLDQNDEFSLESLKDDFKLKG